MAIDMELQDGPTELDRILMYDLFNEKHIHLFVGQNAYQENNEITL